MRCGRCGNDYPSPLYFRAPAVCRDCFERLTDAEQRSLLQPQGIRRMTSTSFSIHGYRIVESLGVIRGITVRSRSILGTLGASLQTIVGGNITLFTELCEKARSEAFEMMVAHAQKIGANAVIGVRYDANEVTSGVTEVLCYGTAVVVEPDGNVSPSSI